MSTRYVWGRYSIVNSLGYDPDSLENPRIIQTGAYFNSYIVYADLEDCTLNGTQITFSNANVLEVTGSLNASVPAGHYFIYSQDGTANITVPISNVFFAGPRLSASISLQSTGGGRYNVVVYNSCLAQITPVQGTLQGYISSASSGAYPQDGVSGDYWYEYQGNDNIDAASVGYSTLEPRGGETITINVTPSSGKVYSGTVSYLYQVQLDGGAWTTIATTTATSQSYTIPKGTQTFAARVRAQDNIGFTSSTYTTGATVTVKNSNAFVGVGGVVRNVEPRVCVNGVIYTNVTSYVCVDGVIRQS